MKFMQLALGSLCLPLISGCASFDTTLEKARAGDPGAQYAIGSAYLKGKEVSQDTKQAGVWLAKAAAQGNRKAQRELLLSHMRDKDVTQVQSIMAQYGAVYVPELLSWGMDEEFLLLSEDYIARLLEAGQTEQAMVFWDYVIKTSIKHDKFHDSYSKSFTGRMQDDWHYDKHYRRFLPEALMSFRITAANLIATQQEKDKKAAEERQLVIQQEKEAAEEKRLAIQQEEERAKAEELRLAKAVEAKAYRENETTFKFPKGDVFKPGITIFKGMVAGAGYEWVKLHMAENGLGDAKLEWQLNGGYANSYKVFFEDGESREVSLRFVGDSLDDPNPVLVGADIVFYGLAVSADDLIEKYRKDLPGTEIRRTQEESERGRDTGFLGVLEKAAGKAAKSLVMKNIVTLDGGGAHIEVASFRKPTDLVLSGSDREVVNEFVEDLTADNAVPDSPIKVMKLLSLAAAEASPTVSVKIRDSAIMQTIAERRYEEKVEINRKLKEFHKERKREALDF